MTSSSTLLEVDQLICGYRVGQPVLSDVTLTLERGGIVALVGPSGGGKTTLLKTLLGLLPPLGGRASVLEGTGRPPCQKKVGYIPQRLGLVEHASVLRNVVVGTLPETGWLRSLLGAFPAEHVQRAHEALEQVGLDNMTGQSPLHLSGGERRRVAIARTLAQRPALLLADELLSELDEATATIVLNAIRQLQQDTDMGVLMVEHNLERSCDLADLVCCLGQGTLRATFAPAPDRLQRARRLLATHALP